MLTGYAPPGWLLKAHPNPRPNLDLKLNPNRISDPDPDPDPNPDQVCFLEVGPARAPLARYLPILMPFYLHLPYTFLSTYRGLRLLWQPLRMASRRGGGSGTHGPGLPAANPNPNPNLNPDPNPNPNPNLIDQACQQVASRPWDGSDCQVPGRRR